MKPITSASPRGAVAEGFFRPIFWATPLYEATAAHVTPLTTEFGLGGYGK